MSAGSKLAGLALCALVLSCLLNHVEIHRLGLLCLSTAVLALCIFSFSRARETAAILKDGVVASFAQIEEDFEIDLERFGRHTRYFVICMSLFALAYWFGIRLYVGLGPGLAGATLAFAEFVLNFEVLHYLTSEKEARFSEVSTARIVALYRVLALGQIVTVLLAISFLLAR